MVRGELLVWLVPIIALAFLAFSIVVVTALSHERQVRARSRTAYIYLHCDISLPRIDVPSSDAVPLVEPIDVVNVPNRIDRFVARFSDSKHIRARESQCVTDERLSIGNEERSEGTVCLRLWIFRLNGHGFVDVSHDQGNDGICDSRRGAAHVSNTHVNIGNCIPALESHEPDTRRNEQWLDIGPFNALSRPVHRDVNSDLDRGQYRQDDGERDDWIGPKSFNPLLYVALFCLGSLLIVRGTYDYLADNRMYRGLVLGAVGSFILSLGIIGLSANWR